MLEETILKLVAAIEANTAAIAAANQTAGAIAAPAAAEPEAPKKKRPAAPSPAPEPTPAPAPAPAAEPTLTVKDALAAAQAVLDSNGNDPKPIAEVNKSYGVKRVSEIPVEKLGEAIAKFKALATASSAL